MTNKFCVLTIGIVTLLCLTINPSISHSQEVDYTGKSIKMLVTGTPGGLTSYLATMVGTYLPLPGNPRVIVRHTARGREIADFNRLYLKGKVDGTEFVASSTPVVSPYKG